jgi:hypothetical protein
MTHGLFYLAPEVQAGWKANALAFAETTRFIIGEILMENSDLLCNDCGDCTNRGGVHKPLGISQRRGSVL